MIIPNLGLTVRTLYGIGRNYAEHAKELGNEIPKEPIIFTKSLASVQWGDGVLELPQISHQVDHEVEVVIAIGQSIRGEFPEAYLTDLIAGMAIGIDVTARDLQKKAKTDGLPWATAKGLPGFAPIGPFVPYRDPVEFSLEVNGAVRQQGSTRDMLHSIAQLLRFVGGRFGLYPGDLIFTGTPAGVGPIQPGDVLKARLKEFASHLTLRAQKR